MGVDNALFGLRIKLAENQGHQYVTVMIESWVENKTISLYDVWSNATQVQNYRQDYFQKLSWRDVKETYLSLISQH